METENLILNRLDTIEENQRLNRVTLQQMNTTLSAIGIQHAEILHLQANQSVQWGKIEKTEQEITDIKCFQAGCPRGSIRALWIAVAGIAGAFGTAIIAHIFGGKP